MKFLGRVDYEPTWREMQRITDTRDANTPDEIWLLEHPPVFTLGLNADPCHVLAAGDIPVVKIDRGGQVTYHGPGQLVVYPLIDIRRAGLGVRDLVTALERAVFAYCASLGIEAECRKNAPGVYVSGQKIASVGLRIRRGASYHGLAFNVNMDLEPFQRINPCGYAGLQMTQLAVLGQPDASVEAVGRAFAPFLSDALAKLATRDAGLKHQRQCGETGGSMTRLLTRLAAPLLLLAFQQPLLAQEATAQELVVIDLRPKEEKDGLGLIGPVRQVQQGCLPHRRRRDGPDQGRSIQRRSRAAVRPCLRWQDAHGAELVRLLQQADARRFLSRQRRHPGL